jgi:hypothetical protein
MRLQTEARQMRCALETLYSPAIDKVGVNWHSLKKGTQTAVVCEARLVLHLPNVGIGLVGKAQRDARSPLELDVAAM